MLYQISNGTMHFGANDVFENIDFQINENEKVAIVGKNGCGKSTLLKIILGELELSSGEIHKSKDAVIGYLKQNAFVDETHTAYDELMEVFKDLIAMEKELNELSLQLENSHDEKLIEKYASMQTQFDYLGGYTYHSEVKTIFNGFGFENDDIYRPLNSFSGGEKTKIGFAKLLLSKPDLLLLDEPTNHLDLRTIEWLETYLSKYNKAMILVSHDRAFLDKTVNTVYEIEYGSMKKYAGNYTSYAKQKKENLLRQETLYKYQQKDIKRLEEMIEKFRYKKNKAKMAQSKIKYLERMERIEDPKAADNKTFKAKFNCRVRGGKNVLSLDHFQFGYDHVLGEVTIDIQRQNRICIMGDNGTGKSTLLKTIIGEIKELGGYKMFGHQIEIGYFDQTLAALNSSKTVLEELWDEYPELDNYQIRSVLGAFLFSSDEVFKELNVLSGGEKVRLALAKLMLKGANFLILDEPTNHLDIISKEALENALKDYDGTILFVSHDRYFIKNIATSCLVLENGKSIYYPDGYKDYIDDKKKTVSDDREDEKKETVPAKNTKPKAKYNIKKIEARISELEDLLETKRDLRFEPEYYHDHQKMQTLDEEIDDIHNEIHHEMEKWELAMIEKEEMGL